MVRTAFTKFNTQFLNVIQHFGTNCSFRLKGGYVLVGPAVKTFDMAPRRNSKFDFELQPRESKDKKVLFYCERNNSGFINIEVCLVSNAPTTY